MAQIVVDNDLFDIVKLLIHRQHFAPQDCELLAISLVVVRPECVVPVPWQSLDHDLAHTQVVHKCQVRATEIEIGLCLVECPLSRVKELSNRYIVVDLGKRPRFQVLDVRVYSISSSIE
jgi:hypothetical protein